MKHPARRPSVLLFAAAAMLLLLCPVATFASDAPAEALRQLSPTVLSDAQRESAAGMIERDLRRRTAAVNLKTRQDWYAIKNRQQWEAFRDERIARLRRSLGTFPAPPKPGELPVRVASRVQGDGYVIENLVYESRPGQWVPGNLYVPAQPRDSMPGILIAHSHHRHKWQGELQDMGMTWARAGCQVLVIDQVGYGERRAHPFHSAADYAKEYRVSRQDYYFRYDSGIQLQLAGDSLMGWFTWDLSRGVDLLLARKGTDPERIIILGAVAGGGDPAAVTAALDERIEGCVPFNFGGPQPETQYPLGENAEETLNYLSGSYWDSTRGLRLSGAEGFLHWVIVGSLAPRRLIHAHEFSWDRPNDPVWKRFQKIYGGFYGTPENLDYTHGYGNVKLSSSEASHCTNIGKHHRQRIHPAFKRWFNIEMSTEQEYTGRRTNDELVCLPPKVREELQPKSLPELVSALGSQRAQQSRARLAKQEPAARRDALRDAWAKLLGPVEPASPPKVLSRQTDEATVAGARVERVLLEVEPDIVVPLVLLRPADDKADGPLVVALAQSGKAGFLEHRAGELARLIAGGATVCMPDVRGTGETRAGTSRGRTSGDGNRSVNMLLFGETMPGQRLRDLRSVLAYLRGRDDVPSAHLMLWGDSFAPVNTAETNFQVPRGVDGRPQQSEPLGGLLAMLGGLFDDRVRAVYVHGGLGSYHSVLTTPYVLIPHDAVVPLVLTSGDLCDVAAALAPRPLQLAGLVDGLNRRMGLVDLRAEYQPAVQSYRSAGQQERLSLGKEPTSAAAWLLEQAAE